MSNWIPQSVWGWLGLVVLALAIFFHKVLTGVGLFISIAIFVWLYFVMDGQEDGLTSTT